MSYSVFNVGSGWKLYYYGALSSVKKVYLASHGSHTRSNRYTRSVPFKMFFYAIHGNYMMTSEIVQIMNYRSKITIDDVEHNCSPKTPTSISSEGNPCWNYFLSPWDLSMHATMVGNWATGAKPPASRGRYAPSNFPALLIHDPVIPGQEGSCLFDDLLLLISNFAHSFEEMHFLCCRSERSTSQPARPTPTLVTAYKQSNPYWPK